MEYYVVPGSTELYLYKYHGGTFTNILLEEKKGDKHSKSVAQYCLYEFITYKMCYLFYSDIFVF